MVKIKWLFSASFKLILSEGRECRSDQDWICIIVFGRWTRNGCLLSRINQNWMCIIVQARPGMDVYYVGLNSLDCRLWRMCLSYISPCRICILLAISFFLYKYIFLQILQLNYAEEMTYVLTQKLKTLPFGNIIGVEPYQVFLHNVCVKNKLEHTWFSSNWHPPSCALTSLCVPPGSSADWKL